AGARDRPRADALRRRRGRRLRGAPAHAGRRQRPPHQRDRAHRAAAGHHRARPRRLARGVPSRRGGGGAGLRPLRLQHHHGHRPGQRHRPGRRREARPADRPAHPERGQGGRLRQRAGRQVAGHRDGHPHPAARRPTQAGRRRRCVGPRHHPHLARRRAGQDRRSARCRREEAV
ncbi:MAG: RuvC, partial [uncultured Nocardioides sp.]